jgi:hypothetical protein
MNGNTSKTNWQWVMAAPWNPELLYEFSYEEIEIREGQGIFMEDPFRRALHRHLTQLIHLADFCGFHNTWARLAENWSREGIPMDQGWKGAAMGGQLAMAGLYQISEKIFKASAGESVELSPLHLWAIRESCRWMRLDFIPQCEEFGGVPFGSRNEIERDLEIVEERFSPVDEVLEGEFDPYARIRLVKNGD